MKILIDADGCPVVNITVEIAKKNDVKCIVLCDTSHIFNFEDVEVITVPRGADSVDFKMVNIVSEKDIVITQDYGLAALCLAKKAIALNQNGMEYNEFNIDSLLLFRHISREIRMAGGKTKSVKKRSHEQDKEFAKVLEDIISRIIMK